MVQHGDRHQPWQWAAALGLLVVVWWCRHVLLLLGLALVLAVFLHRIISGLERLSGLGYRVCFGLVLGGLCLGILASSWTVGSQVVAQTQGLLETLPSSLRQVEAELRQHPTLLRVYEAVNDSVEQDFILDRAMGIGSTAVGALTGSGLVLALAIYLVFEPALYRRGLLQLVPSSQRGLVDRMLKRLYQDMTSYLWATLYSMAIIGLLTTLGLWLIDLPMFLALGLLAGLLEFIPYLGPLLAGVPILLVAFSVGPEQTMWACLCYAAIQLLESWLITPMVHRDMVRLPPALTLLCQSLMAVLFGVLGVVLAAPTTRTLMTSVQVVQHQKEGSDAWAPPDERDGAHPGLERGPGGVGVSGSGGH
ncbi:MAG: AI-2E family transporter [Vulcanimicrobiota bacterium]